MSMFDGAVVCPFYTSERDSKTMNCELARFRFPDAECKAQIKAHCCDMQLYKQCTLYKVLNSYYQRKYEDSKNDH